MSVRLESCPPPVGTTNNQKAGGISPLYSSLAFLFIINLLMLTGRQFASAQNIKNVNDLLVRAGTQLGSHYVYGGRSPGNFDCSGFVSWVFNPVFSNFPRISRDQALIGTTVAQGEWQPGDLLFFATGSNPDQINHVAIWFGNGYIIHSVSNGPETGVIVTPSDSKYWKARYRGSRRILPESFFTFESGVAEKGPGISIAHNSTSNQLNPLADIADSQTIPDSESKPDQEEADPSSSLWDNYSGIVQGDSEFSIWLTEGLEEPDNPIPTQFP